VAGNVRELRNLMERAAVLVEGAVVQAADLAPLARGWPGARRGGGVARRDRAPRIRDDPPRARDGELERHSGRRRLGIDRTNLHRRMRKYAISRR